MSQKNNNSIENSSKYGQIRIILLAAERVKVIKTSYGDEPWNCLLVWDAVIVQFVILWLARVVVGHNTINIPDIFKVFTVFWVQDTIVRCILQVYRCLREENFQYGFSSVLCFFGL